MKNISDETTNTAPILEVLRKHIMSRKIYKIVLLDGEFFQVLTIIQNDFIYF